MRTVIGLPVSYQESEKSEPKAATIARVYDDGNTVDLNVFDRAKLRFMTAITNDEKFPRWDFIEFAEPTVEPSQPE